VHRGGDAHSLGEHEELQLVLLEYGARGASSAALAAAAAASSQSSSSTASTKGGADKSEALAREEEAAYQRRMARLAALGDGDLSDSTVAGFIPSAQIAAMLDNFEAGLNAEDGPIAGVQAKKLAERQHAAHVASLEAQVAQFKQDGQKLTAKNNAARDEHDQLAADVAQRRAFTARLRAAIAELDALETDENRPVLAKLKQLVALNESLRAHEAAFRRSCAAELTRLKALIAEAEQKARAAADEGGLAEREALLAEAEAKDARKREQLENALAERRCAIAAAERQLDAVPSRVEMQQYQRQFVELYQQIAAKEVETRRYFNTYNTLEDTRTFLNRETQIYSSILEGYKAAMSSKSGRANFATEMANIAKGVQDSLAKVTGKLETETSKKQSFDQQYKELVDKERLFVKLAGKFADACGRNEKLEAEIAQLTNEAAGK
jgi:chromosome segregation ATPase